VQRIDPSTRQPIDTDGDGVNDALGGGTPFTGDRISLGGNSFSAIGNANIQVENPALRLVFSTALGQYDLTAFLEALQREELADLQAEPTIVTLDNRRAEILVGQEVPVRVIDAGAAAGGGGAGGAQGAGLQGARAQVSVREAGINLEVTPHITNNRQILMQLHAENSDAQLASTDVGVIFNKQTADNQLLVGDGQTAVIGGLTVTTVSKTRSGIPFLMNIPYVGWLFRQTRTQEIKRDLLILVTPHIVDEGEAVGAGSGAGTGAPPAAPPRNPPSDRD
jgi:type IV pilus assembly protein PilQ